MLRTGFSVAGLLLAAPGQAQVIDYANGSDNTSPIQITTNATQFQTSAGVVATQSGVISEDIAGRPLEKIGSGTLSFTAANSYTGGTTISNGTLQIDNIDALGSGPITLNGVLRANTSGILSNPILFLSDGTGTIATTVGHTLSLTGEWSSFEDNQRVIFGSSTDMGTILFAPSAGVTVEVPRGAIEVAGGTLRAGNWFLGFVDAATTTVDMGALLDFDDTGVASTDTINTLMGAGQIRTGSSPATTLRIGGGVFSGQITGAGRLQVGALCFGPFSVPSSSRPCTSGVLALSGANTYSGGTSVSGTVEIANMAALGTGLVTLGSFSLVRSTVTGTLSNDFNIISQGIISAAPSQTLTLTGNFSSGSSITIFGTLADTGTIVLAPASATADLLSKFSVDGGTLRFGNNRLGALVGAGSAIHLDSNAALDLGGVSVIANSLAGAGQVQTNGAILSVVDGRFFSGTIVGSGGFHQLPDVPPRPNPGGGTLAAISGKTIFTNSNTYTGGTTIDAGGILQLGNGGASGSIVGNVVDNGVFQINRTDTYAFGGNILGSGSFNQLGTGTVILTGANTYSGGTTIAAGTLQLGNGGTSGSITGNIVNSGALVLDRSDAVVFAGVILGPGVITLNGAGKTTLSGAQIYTGPTTVNAGILSVNGSIASSSGVIVNAGGTLSGTGTVARTVINGGTLAPGNSIGAITVSGTLSITSSGIYAAEISPSAADLTTVTGSASIAGNLQAIAIGGSYTPGTHYTLIDAEGGVSGTFGTLTVTGSFGPTVRAHLSYDANHVYLVLDPNVIAPFLSGASLNEAHVAGAIDNAVLRGVAPTAFTELATLAPRELNAALNSLSGEIHASLRSAALYESRFVRQAVFKRLEAGSAGEAMSAQASTADGATIWGQAFGAWGSVDGDGNASEMHRDIGGFFAGIEMPVGGIWHLGVLAGYSRANGDIANTTSSHIDSAAHIAAYIGAAIGPWRVRLGGANAWNDFTTYRFVLSFAEALEAAYSGRTAQGFGELGYAIDAGGIKVEPFAGVAYVNLETDAFKETGGAAALAAPNQSDSITYSTLGVRTADAFNMMSGIVSVHGSAAWQHGFGARISDARLSFVNSGTGFLTLGSPLTRDSALVEVGAGLSLDPGIDFSFDYSSQLGSGFTDNGIKGYVSWSF